MDVWTLTHRDLRRLVTLIAVGCLLFSSGCSNSGGDAESSDQSEAKPYAASGGLPPSDASDQAGTGPDPSVDPTQEVDPRQEQAVSAPAEAADVAPRLELRPNLPPQQLVATLAEIDGAIRMIRNGQSGITDQREARKELLRVIKLKLEASRQLSAHPDADTARQSEGSRGAMQALSHLASLGDLKAAQELEPLAEKNLQSDDRLLATDSRLVLLGFGIESLKNGDESSPQKIVDLVKGFGESNPTTDVPALMVLGQARYELFQYGHQAESRMIRQTILELFADSPDPQIAELAAQAAGNVQDDAIDTLLAAAVRGENVSVDQWTESVEGLISESRDLQTVQYLAGAALEFESLGQEDLVAATFRSLEKHFDDPESATAAEIDLAIDARQARQQVIGWTFETDHAGADGNRLNMEDYRGRVVLMPFWAMSFPHSLAMVPQLKAIADANSDAVAIVGVNLDVEGAPVAGFLENAELGFRSFRCESSPTEKVSNPMAARFGLVSMPFVAILDQKGKVAAIKLTARDLEETVQRLVTPR